MFVTTEITGDKKRNDASDSSASATRKSPAGFTLHRINVAGLRGKSKLSLLKAPFVLLNALFQARKIIRQLKPVCVLGFGGYVTGPGGLAAKTCGVPVIIHEQNAVAGTANRLLVPMTRRVCEAFPQTFAASDTLRTTGNPVRPELFTLAPRAALEGRKARLLVLGGSLGAEPLNKLLPEALAKVPAEVRPEVFHQAGKQHDQITAERYTAVGVEADVQPFIKDMAHAYGWADLVVCRAGALTVSELAAAGLPSLLVPLPHAIDDHQSRNAEFLAREGAAFVMPQATTGAAELAARLTEVLMQPERLNSMATNARRLAKPDATRNVVDICLEVANG